MEPEIDCAQCHDHPLAREIKQAHYWGLVAAFNRSKNVGDSSEVEEVGCGRLRELHEPAEGVSTGQSGSDDRRARRGGLAR
jgi:hypothetical protein